MSKIKNALVQSIIDGIQNIKGKNVTVLDLREVDSSESEYFVLCEGQSSTHVRSITDSIEDTVREQTGEKSLHVEGFANAQWILMDYSNIIVHVFQKSTREFYSLESLWDDAKRTDIPDLD